MPEIIGVRFKSVGKVYYFSPGDLTVEPGSSVIVETARGIECGETVFGNKSVPDEEIVAPLKTVIRIATPDDFRQIEKNRVKEQEAFKVCEEKIERLGLKMSLIDVECTFDNSKLLFYFTAENRVDFRELVKELAAVYRTRIELRQIGVRDEAKCSADSESAGGSSAVQASLATSSRSQSRWRRNSLSPSTRQRFPAHAAALCAV